MEPRLLKIMSISPVKTEISSRFRPNIPPLSTFHYIALNNDINLDNIHFDPDTSGDFLPMAMRNIALAKIQDINLDSDDSSMHENLRSPSIMCSPQGKRGSARIPSHPPRPTDYRICTHRQGDGGGSSSLSQLEI